MKWLSHKEPQQWPNIISMWRSGRVWALTAGDSLQGETEVNLWSIPPSSYVTCQEVLQQSQIYIHVTVLHQKHATLTSVEYRAS